MEKHDLIVVGAGISGMSFAHYAAKANMKSLILEKSDKPGGSFDTQKSHKLKGNFWIELGAHTCYNSYRNLIEVMEDCGIVNEISSRAKVPFRALVGDQIKSFPSQINFLELLVSLPKIFGKKKSGETVSSYYGSILGKKNFKKIFSALFSAVPSQNADDFPADVLFKKRERRKDILKHFTMSNGLSSITDKIVKESGIEIKYNVNIKVITRSDDGYVITSPEQTFACKNLAICVSIPSVEDLVKPIAPKVAEKVSKIQYQSIESFGVVVEKNATNLKPFAGLVPTNDVFFSAVSRDTVPDDQYRGFTFHFKPGILSKEQKIEKVCEILHIRQDQIIEMKDKQNIVPSLRLGHYELINEIDRLLDEKRLFLSGNYFDGLSIEDCVSRSKAEVVRMVGN